MSGPLARLLSQALAAELASAGVGCSIPAALLGQDGVVRLREPAHSDRRALVRRLRKGAYDKPFVVDEGHMRRLHFGFRYVQGEVSRAKPDEIPLVYLRKMLAALLFVPRPREVLLIGLGAGTLTRFFHRQLPGARITTVEVDADVIALAPLFGVPHPDRRLRLVHDDALAYLAKPGGKADLILFDACDKGGTAAAFRSERSYRNLLGRLRPRGVLVVNLIGRPERMRAHVQLLQRVFPGRLLVAAVGGAGGNRVAFAFEGTRGAPDWSRIESRAARLAHRHGLDFQGLARWLRDRWP